MTQEVATLGLRLREAQREAERCGKAQASAERALTEARASEQEARRREAAGEARARAAEQRDEARARAAAEQRDSVAAWASRASLQLHDVVPRRSRW